MYIVLIKVHIRSMHARVQLYSNCRSNWLHSYLHICRGKSGREGWQAHLHLSTHRSLGVVGTKSSTGTPISKACGRNGYKTVHVFS